MSRFALADAKLKSGLDVRLLEERYNAVVTGMSSSMTAGSFGRGAASTRKREWIETVSPARALLHGYPYPFINTRFIWAYMAALGGYLDALGGLVDAEGKGDPPSLGVVLRSPSLMAKALFGYFFPDQANMIVSFRYKV